MGGWSELSEYLRSSDEGAVVLSYEEIERIMDMELPASARVHPPFWANSERNSYARHWMSAGYKTSTRGVVAGSIRFEQTGMITGHGLASTATPKRERPASDHERPASSAAPMSDHRRRQSPTTSASTSVDVMLVGCVKKKRETARPAKDLYCSALWAKRRAYVEASGVRWFILSAEHGLVDPDTLLQPYDTTLKTMSSAERRAWATEVDHQIAAKYGPLIGNLVEIHAGMDYQQHLRPLLAARGASITYPLEGLSQGRQLQWYDSAQGARTPHKPPEANAEDERPAGIQRFDNLDGLIANLTDRLLDPGVRVAAADFRSLDRSSLQQPGLYSWWADSTARSFLGRALDIDVGPLIYVGQAGATRWPSGKPSNATLWSRITSQHLSGRITTSTFRLTLTSLLHEPLRLRVGQDDLDTASKKRLTSFITQHLSVAPIPTGNPDTLSRIEERIVTDLDPPLNLNHVDRTTPSRRRISEQRKRIDAQLRH